MTLYVEETGAGPPVVLLHGWGLHGGVFAPLVALTLLFGVAPKPVLDMSAASVAQLLDNYNRAIAAPKTAALSAHDPKELAPGLDSRVEAVFGKDHAPLIIPVSTAR